MKVLIVEQEKTLQHSLSFFMAEHYDFEVSLAHSKKEGISLLAKDPFDIILCRDRLPDGDGLEMLKELGRQNPKITSILMTAHGDEDLRQEALRAGINGYLEKPFDLQQLEEAMGVTRPR